MDIYIHNYIINIYICLGVFYLRIRNKSWAIFRAGRPAGAQTCPGALGRCSWCCRTLPTLPMAGAFFLGRQETTSRTTMFQSEKIEMLHYNYAIYLPPFATNKSNNYKNIVPCVPCMVVDLKSSIMNINE